MKFKNYRNSYTNDNKIYSFKDIYNMPIGEVLKRKQELLSQYRVLGVPTESELQASPDVVYVQAYTRDDGVKVKAHYRSKPDGITSNNLSSKNSIGGAAGIRENRLKNITLKNNYETNFIQDKLIDYNNEQNKEYQDARFCMNIAIIGPENIKDNKNYQLLSNEEVKNINSKFGIELSNGIKTVKFSEISSMANSLNNSQELKQQLKNNINKIKYDKNFQVSFNKDENLFRSLHNATVFDCKIENGTITGYIYDKYDFDYQSYIQNKKKDMNKVNIANNAAATIQRMKLIKNYNILVPIKIKL